MHACARTHFRRVRLHCRRAPPPRLLCYLLQASFMRIFAVWTLFGLFLGSLDFVCHFGPHYGLHVDQILRHQILTHAAQGQGYGPSSCLSDLRSGGVDGTCYPVLPESAADLEDDG